MRNASSRADGTSVEVRLLGTVDYDEAYQLQHRLADQRASGELDHDVMLLLEHPSVYTAGKRTEDSDRPVNGARVIEVDRGGRITWHGPGQLVGYPIIKLAEPLDVVDYVRRLEEALIGVCARNGVTTGRVAGRSGVWISDAAGERKLGQVGIRVAKGVTLHGFALNVDPDMTVFDAIVPCGIADAGVTSLAKETGSAITVDSILDDVAELVQRCLDDASGPALDPSVGSVP
ncbi:lipoyl(octanoyl) transferase LipB [Gordonia sp. (in: high G+C Gram-positive bacteria)]|uniref:lipoyl(octanoyl) transferase LipB n=1 Tax=Gordonia sp. (in: high G+C Gram-positive bacteria) TaxID=84139 RepID=UPI0016A762CA|nr:lipoyl(octanoyl) transferase LipB [Gordonia sp. (in: high G+C Gram-positive bacteria)]NLG46898.1 lipoyl(octanoyl) transferase LipB [Gordonia sp. (in: high G+C Gram-positive bacteria)]